MWHSQLSLFPNLRLLGCFLLLYFGGVVVVVLVVVVLVTGGKQSQLQVLRLRMKFVKNILEINLLDTKIQLLPITSTFCLGYLLAFLLRNTLALLLRNFRALFPGNLVTAGNLNFKTFLLINSGTLLAGY